MANKLSRNAFLPIITSPMGWEGNPTVQVQCPTCGDPYTHHDQVAVYQRRHEDGPVTRWSPGEPVAIVPEAECPSPRRDAIRIGFRCESGHRFWLDIIQHKGITFVVAPPDKAQGSA